MNTDYRALCAELLNVFESYDDESNLAGIFDDMKANKNDLLDRARAALAELEPEVVGPTDEELMEAFDGEFAEFFDSSDGFGTTAIPRSEWIKVARAVLARWGHQPAPPVEGEVVGPEWRPCVKLPITVHVREQRAGETHVSTREGITPVRPDDLIMRGVQGEEYPIGRELFEKTYRLGPAEPAPPAAGGVGEAALVRRMCEIILGNTFGNEELDSLALLVGHHPDVLNASTLPAHALPLPQGEVAKLAAKLRRLAPHNPLGTADPTITRAADLLEQQATAYAICERERLHQSTRAADLEIERHPAPVPVAERLPGPEDCDAEGRCWWFLPAQQLEILRQSDAWSFRKHSPRKDHYCHWTHWLSATALPVPGQGEI